MPFQSIQARMKKARLRTPRLEELFMASLFVCCADESSNLRQHETVSALHKHILAKRKKVTSKSKENDYRDRATERRKMYEPDPDTKCSVVHPVDITLVTDGPSLTKARTVNSTEAVIPNQMLNETNIGNKMLQKLGWKGGSLGTGKMDGNNNQLKQDWERIETLVAATKGKL